MLLFGLRTFFFVLFVFCLFTNPSAEANVPIKAAFIRDHQLWVKIGDKEQRITTGEIVSTPKWSHDGRYVAFSEGENADRLWIYDTKSEQRAQLADRHVTNYEWAPSGNLLAFQQESILHLSDLKAPPAYVAPGVGNFSWWPDGNGFIASSNAPITPKGWGQVGLYRISLKGDLISNELLYQLPKMGNSFFAIGTSAFKWSHDGKWAAFIAIPTASWSMDSNTLSVIGHAGKVFEKADPMLLNENWFKWGPRGNVLAYIEGEGRIVTKNKHLKVKEMPAVARNVLTPKGVVDRDFDWLGSDALVVSRSAHAEWSNHPNKRPLPTLYSIELATSKQVKRTDPPLGFGDFFPIAMKSQNRLAWVRTNRQTADVWLANADGSNPKPWIKHLDMTESYYEKWAWEQKLAIYHEDTNLTTSKPAPLK